MKTQNRVGLYLTIIVHLVILIVVLCYGITAAVHPESSFVIDFTKQEELERIQEKEERREALTREVEELISGVRQNTRNVVVDRGQKLRDDRFKNPSQVYDEAKRLQEKLDQARRQAIQEQGEEEIAESNKENNKKTNAPAYTGPSVLEYFLEGRKAMSLPIPVYKCLGGGDVTVMIEVDRKGYVVGVAVKQGFSSADACLQAYALKAARASRFTIKQDAPPRQSGEIVYRFMAQ